MYDATVDRWNHNAKLLTLQDTLLGEGAPRTVRLRERVSSAVAAQEEVLLHGSLLSRIHSIFSIPTCG